MLSSDAVIYSPMPYFSIPSQTGQAAAEKRRIYYSDQGEGEILIFLHSWYQTGQEAYLPYIEHFCKNYRVIVPDLPGHGKSYRKLNEDFTFEQMTEELVHFIEHFKEEVGESVGISLVGSSMGSYLALLMALNQPQLIENLMLISTMIDFKVNELEIESMLSRSPVVMRANLLYRAKKKIFPFDAGKSPYWQKQGQAPGWYQHYRQKTELHDLHDARIYMNLFLKSSLVEEIPKNTHPTLLIYGKRDFLTPEDFAASLARKMPTAVLRIVDSVGHNLYLTHPEKVIPLLEEFLDENKKRRFRWLNMFWRR